MPKKVPNFNKTMRNKRETSVRSRVSVVDKRVILPTNVMTRTSPNTNGQFKGNNASALVTVRRKALCVQRKNLQQETIPHTGVD